MNLRRKDRTNESRQQKSTPLHRPSSTAFLSPPEAASFTT
jgi:hypothetical protein